MSCGCKKKTEQPVQQPVTIKLTETQPTPTVSKPAN